MNINKYKALVFDFDGVIVNSVNIKGNAFCELYQNYGENIKNAVHKYHTDNGGMDRFKKISYFESVLLGRPHNEKNVLQIADMFSKLVKKQVCQAPEIPGAIKFIEYWHNKVPCFINSATPTDELIDIIKERNWGGYFMGIYGSPQSKLDNLNDIFSKHGLIPQDIIFFGDAFADISAATEAGTHFCGITLTSTPEFINQLKNLDSVRDFLKFITT